MFVFLSFSLHYCKPTTLMISGICQTLKTKIPCLPKTVAYIQYIHQIYMKYFVLFGITFKNICHIKRKQNLCYMYVIKSDRQDPFITLIINWGILLFFLMLHFNKSHFYSLFFSNENYSFCFMQVN